MTRAALAAPIAALRAIPYGSPHVPPLPHPLMRVHDDGSLDEDWLDEEFPLGEGTAETEGTVLCPYCGEPNEVALDPGSGARQDYVEDCQVCCQPWRVVVAYHADGTADVTALPADGR